ncbi:hypothetical protein JSY14_06725 [Brachybacterium sp. EF45031]|uniref:hypothetical protein n=1 Tax=Brachybacterium sillae TaxID=2810536 RepID=UPI00217DADD1|nr:hypothetical protein [Brachybacterium sillae]MCS6711729.1 hypothetical protein [Brachybacterium sillae]
MTDDIRRSTADRPHGGSLVERLFAEEAERLELTTEGGRHTGALPDLQIPLEEASGSLLGELRGVQVRLPGAGVWGPLEDIRPAADGQVTVSFADGRTVDVPPQTHLHVAHDNWVEAQNAGGVDLRPGGARDE